MPTYTINVTRILTLKAILTLDAASEAEAGEQAMELASTEYLIWTLPPIDWQEDDQNVIIDDVNTV